MQALRAAGLEPKAPDLADAAPKLSHALRELVAAVHAQEPASIARAMRGATATLVSVEGVRHG